MDAAPAFAIALRRRRAECRGTWRWWYKVSATDTPKRFCSLHETAVLLPTVNCKLILSFYSLQSTAYSLTIAARLLPRMVVNNDPSAFSEAPSDEKTIIII